MDGTYIVNGTRLTGLTVYSNAPVGTEIIYLGSTAPIGWLVEDGSAISRTDYAALFSVIGTHYGSGDGSTTFNLPNKTAQDGIVLIKATEVASLEANAINDSQTTGSNAWSAQKVNTELAKVDNTTVTMESGVSAFSNNVYKNGKVVSVQVEFNVLNFGSANDITIGTLPEGYRPKRRFFTLVPSSSVSPRELKTFMACFVDALGVITVYKKAGDTVNFVWLDFTFICE